MSWVERLESGRHRAVYRDPDDRKRSKTIDKKADAKKWLAEKVLSDAVEEGLLLVNPCRRTNDARGRVETCLGWGRVLPGLIEELLCVH